MAAVTPEAAEACTRAAVEVSMAAGMLAAFVADIPVVMPVADPMGRAAITVLAAVPSPVTPGLGKATALAITLRDGISLHPATPAMWPTPEPQLPPPGLCHPHPRHPARLELERCITRPLPTANGTPSPARARK